MSDHASITTLIRHPGRREAKRIELPEADAASTITRTIIADITINGA